MQLVAGNKLHVWTWLKVQAYFVGIPWRGASNDSGVVENCDY